MTINLTVPDKNETPQLSPKITVIGVGGAGGNAVNNMIQAELEGVEFVVANTDSQSLAQSRADRRIQLGATITQGLGAGSRPEIGRAAAEEALEEILAELDGSHMAFVAAGMGGGTGTGGAPVIARAAKEHGILTVGVVTKPFQFEGSHRATQAEAGIEDLEQFVDTLIVIPNQNLFRIANEKTTFADAFAMADEVLYSGVRGVTDLMVMPGLINLDFADIRTVMSEMGKAMMGTGEAEGERRALDAAEAAIANPLLDDTSMKGARGVLINITGGMDITLFEVDEAANRIRAEVDPEAYIIVGSAFDASMDGIMRVSVVATGIDADAAQAPMPTMLHLADQIEHGYSSRPRPAPQSEPEPGYEPAEFTSAPAPESLPEPEPEPEPEPVVDTDEDEAAAGELPIERTLGETEAEADDGDGDGDRAETADAEAAPAMADGDDDDVAAAPSAMPAVHAVDSFIPPEAASAEDDRVSAMTAEASDTGLAEKTPAPMSEETVPATQLDAQDEAADAAATPRRLPGVSLFERVTGGGRAAFGKKGIDPAPAPEVMENKELSDTETDTEETVTEIEAVSDGQPALGGLDPEDRLPDSESDDDLLDIPAFLRRQAN